MVHLPKSERLSCYNQSAPAGAGNTARGLTHSLDRSKEGLMPNYTHTCSVDGCQNKVGRKGARGWCSKHYQRWMSTGSPTGSKKRSTTRLRRYQPAEQRFWAYVEKTDGCWQWKASFDSSGYGLLSVSGKSAKAHRFAYELLVGPIPHGLVIDHLCRNRACVNPAHMEPVTNYENLRRGAGHDVSQGRRNQCINGHDFTEENTYINPKGAKVCRACSDRSRKKYQERKAA